MNLMIPAGRNSLETEKFTLSLNTFADPCVSLRRTGKKKRRTEQGPAVHPGSCGVKQPQAPWYGATSAHNAL